MITTSIANANADDGNRELLLQQLRLEYQADRMVVELDAGMGACPVRVRRRGVRILSGAPSSEALSGTGGGAPPGPASGSPTGRARGSRSGGQNPHSIRDPPRHHFGVVAFSPRLAVSAMQARAAEARPRPARTQFQRYQAVSSACTAWGGKAGSSMARFAPTK